MANKGKEYYEGYISRNQLEIIQDLADEGNTFSLITLNTLLEIELSNKKRDGIVTKLREFIGIKEKQDSIKKEKVVKTTGRKIMAKTRYVIWRGASNGLSLPEQFNRLTLVKDAPIPATDDAIEFLTANWPKEDYEITDRAETEEETTKEEKKRK